MSLAGGCWRSELFHSTPCMQVWDRWPDGSPPTLSGAATLPLALLAEIAQPSGPTPSHTLLLPLMTLSAIDKAGRQQVPQSPNAGDEADGEQVDQRPLLEVQLQYEAVQVGSHPRAVGEEEPDDAASPTPAVAEGVMANISIDIIQACGLQVRCWLQERRTYR